MSNHIRPILTAADYEMAQQRAAKLLLGNPVLGSPLSDELIVLGTLIASYDAEHFPIGPADPIAAIEFAMDQHGLVAKDLVAHLGTRSRVTEVLQGKRGLTLDQISRLHHGLGIPLACLIPQAGRTSGSRRSSAVRRIPPLRGRQTKIARVKPGKPLRA
jgi:HTH-type transcriptional regulator/antitoxin HigA